LGPERITRILGVEPTLAYRKGEVYRRDGRGHAVRGRTGLWLLSSEGRVQSSDVIEHLRFLLAILFPSTDPLRELLRDGDIEADVPVFWHGAPGSPRPTIPDEVRAAFRRLPAKIEQDFGIAA
jgi:Domain of unknown function (DUF4279)